MWICASLFDEFKANSTYFFLAFCYVVEVRTTVKPFSHNVQKRDIDSVDQNQTPQNAASDQGLHCLQ